MSVLRDYASSAIVPCTDLAKAKAFYGAVLGLPLIADHGNGFVFATGATKLNIYLSDSAGTNRANAVIWAVGDEIEGIAAALRAKGVTLDEYPQGFDEVVEGVHVRGALRVIWFRDPDDNILHVTSGHAN
jgi:catechol 2,3-dioxygenase-like lactoylglutathione lyase family enzyme